MAHHDDRRALRRLIGPDIFQNALAADGVQSRRGLIQNQNVRLHRDHARNRGSALLPAGKIEGRFFKVLVRNADKARRTQHTRANLVLRKAHVLRAESDVLKDRLFKELILRVLEHQPHMKAQAARELRVRPHVLSLKQHLPV